MPKVMMIGKVSSLRGRTRRAGSFRGSLGTVVLEGSRAQSRRYGMGNIAGSDEQHRDAIEGRLKQARLYLHKAEAAKTCSQKTEQALRALRYANMAFEEGRWFSGHPDLFHSRRIRDAAERMVRACVSPSSGMGGARSRRRGR